MLKLGSELNGKLKTYPCVLVSRKEGYAIYNIHKKGRSVHRSEAINCQYLVVAIIQCDMRHCDCP